ncbi:phosphotransferase [Glaesserella sp.]|uniref:phosphotransferase n=1 Tax=Glaesserella sp. TaxID=2094731 RepID=UPI00359F33FD
MLINADKQIIARDLRLPGLAALLDRELLLEKIQQIPQFKHALNAEVQYLRYKPGNSCACTVKVEFSEGKTSYYFVKALTKARFEESWNHPQRQKLIQEKDPNAPLAILELNIMFLHPAYDRGIRHLGWLADAKARQRLLARSGFSEIENGEFEIDILRYKPERRLVACIRQGKNALAVIRCINPKDFGKVLTGATFGAAQGSVKLLNTDGAHCTLITNWQQGISLCPEDGILPSKDITVEVAKLLASIHGTSYRHPIEYKHQHEIKSMQGVSETFKHILPQYSAWFDSLTERVTLHINAQPEQFTLIHGDFSLDQIVLNQSKQTECKLAILDWDRAANGNPLLDLATFQARLELQVIEGVLVRWQADELLQTFLSAYQQETACSLDGLDFFVASAMLRLAAEPFRKRGAMWDQYSLQLLQRVEQVIAKVTVQSEIITETIQDFSADPLLSTLLDRDEMQQLLMRALPETEHGELESIKLRRYKTHRRALIDYVINGKQGKIGIIGKYRSKGLDKRSYLVQQALWNAGFNHNAPIRVPQPLGALNDQHMWLQRRISGWSIGELLFPENQRLAFLGEAVANALITLHQSNVAQQQGLPIWTAEHEMQILRDRLNQAQSLLPQWKERIAVILSNCECLAQTLRAIPLVSVHRDFYQDQILECDGQPGCMVLLDLDLFCQGVPALDAGNYLAHIQEFALRRYGDIAALEKHQNAFVQRFLAADGVTQYDIEVFITLSLARHIFISTQFNDRRHTTESLITLCEQRLGLTQ